MWKEKGLKARSYKTVSFISFTDSQQATQLQITSVDGVETEDDNWRLKNFPRLEPKSSRKEWTNETRVIVLL